ncbi:L-aspartate oxidase [Psychrobacter cryohalolentis]|uniref:L-aspartate oxidase n=1 Tax=Psychrobacter cryohalolentis (strain ATCC BAA-1226 / DSM 17306 / VKM B-2378 / K5) TaxID=335284 RepID=Q1QD71_PSYCK|nr:L-aspartate oxidase [Psychrobacter cryohalolentis]ABE74382.1 L-aspartate oxidase [Psychrobacter cryohalolentis K5]
MSANWLNGKDNCNAHQILDAVVITDVLIVGAGLAGLSTALALPESLSITILSKAALEVCSSHYAQGGIAASLDKNDSVADHITDTLIAGAGLCAADNTTNILSAGQQAVQWLCEQGVPFTQIPQANKKYNTEQKVFTKLQTADLHLTKEGGHGCRRVAHADDATGRHIMEALTIKAQAASNITILPYHEALYLLTDNSDNRCQGAQVFDHIIQRQITFHSRAVVLASGGLGQLFQRASAPNVCVGDGVMMAWQAGCRLANLEFIQFHPTGLALGDSSFLISEALRGEGGRLYCPQTGDRFMLEIDERAELAPRDIVARAIAEQINNNGLGYVHLDVSHLPAEFLQEHFPQIYQTLLALGIGITKEPIPVAPTAHYSCGGVVTDANGVTDVAGLYAAGEVAYTGLHGANRLASNSLLECVVVGRNIAADLPRYLKALENLDTAAIYESINLSAPTIWTAPTLKDTQAITLSSFITHPLTSDDYEDTDSNIDTNNQAGKITTELKILMTTYMGITRTAESLEQMLIQIQQWQQWLEKSELSQPNINASDDAMTIDKLAHFQLARQLQLATLIVQSACQRLESRGGHYRRDYPNLAATARISVIEPLSNQAICPLSGINNPTSEIQKHHKFVQSEQAV